MQEFGFELALCAALERPDRVVSRQLGAGIAGRRVVDTVLLEPGPEFDERAAVTDRTIPPAAIAADVGPGRARAVADLWPDWHPDRRADLVDRAVAAGFFERERRDGRTYVRQTVRYPEEWVGRLVAVENKPDLDRPGDLRDQLRTDVSVGLFDAVVLATGTYVTGAHLNRLPEAVGVWRFDPETREREVVREPTPLAPDEAGVELLDRSPARVDVNPVTAAEKARRRRAVAERAYGKGWRTFDLPACEHCAAADGGLPHCAWKGRLVRPVAECGPDCDGHERAAPPDADHDALRAERTAWVRDPAGRARRQAGLDRFRD